MAKRFLTDEEVETEIEKLQKSELVKLTRKKRQIEYRRRQYLYQLRNMEKEGKKLHDAGITIEMLNEMDVSSEDL